MFLCFKAIKAKKAAVVVRKTKLKTGKFVDSEILSNHLVRFFNVPLAQKMLLKYPSSIVLEHNTHTLIKAKACIDKLPTT